ncbi:MAG TPA: CvpA family protein [Bacteroidales bacterium]|jgi:membrane protein required for colicin V production|nr:CvpA family protein [Bacteroidales bacterium]
MNYIDMFIAVLLIWALYKGYTRGFIMQLTILAALALGVYAALKLSGFTATRLEGRLDLNSETLYLVAVAVTFILVFVGVNIIGKLIEKVVESADLSFLNRLTGVILSLAKTAIIVGVLLAYINRLDQKMHFVPENTREHSLFYKPLTNIATKIFPSLAVEKGYRGQGEQV